ncbi:hypothetical protein KKH39_02150 [Patescibacteria group bacterium]|nr:hypothetical protein [Patescibacteria group bacterium]
MTQAEKFQSILADPKTIVLDTNTSVEVIDPITGQVQEIIILPAGSYTLYFNYDLDQIGEIRSFVEDPSIFNRLLRLPEGS